MAAHARILRAGAGVAVVALLLTLPAAPGAAAGTRRGSPAPGCADVVVSFRTFHVTMAAERRAYRPGDTARIEVTVTRPAAEDPLGLGVGAEPPGEVPAADVGLGVGVRAGDAFLTGSQRTDDEGTAVVEISLPKSVSTGTVEVSGFAWETWWRGGCLIVEEWGYRKEPGLFKIKPRKR